MQTTHCLLHIAVPHNCKAQPVQRMPRNAWGYLCSHCIACLQCLHAVISTPVCLWFDSAILTSLYMFGGQFCIVYVTLSNLLTCELGGCQLENLLTLVLGCIVRRTLSYTCHFNNTHKYAAVI